MPASAETTATLRGLSPVADKPIIAAFDAEGFSASGGLLTLREIERRLGLAPRLAAHIADPREPTQVVHPTEEIVRFRMLMIAAGYEDGNDADVLRHDPMFKLAMAPADQRASVLTVDHLAAGEPAGPAHPAAHGLRHDRLLLRQLPPGATADRARHR